MTNKTTKILKLLDLTIYIIIKARNSNSNNNSNNKSSIVWSRHYQDLALLLVTRSCETYVETHKNYDCALYNPHANKPVE
jgi:hypothetical protein